MSAGSNIFVLYYFNFDSILFFTFMPWATSLERSFTQVQALMFFTPPLQRFALKCPEHAL